jgi:hypothetical protein
MGNSTPTPVITYFLTFITAVIGFILQYFTLIILPGQQNGAIITPTITLISTGIVFVLLLLVYIFNFLRNRPAVNIEFSHPLLPIALVRKYASLRADDFNISAYPKRKLTLLSRIFCLNENDLRALGLQIYWEPRESLQVTSNYSYDSLHVIDEYPIIDLSQLTQRQLQLYKMKIGCTQHSIETQCIEIKARILCSIGLRRRARLMSRFVNLGMQNKKVIIRD